MPLLTTPNAQHLLDDEESNRLESFLKIMRCPEPWAHHFASWVDFRLREKGETPKPEIVAEGLATGLDQQYGEREYGGLLYANGNLYPLEVLSGTDENDNLERFLKLLRSEDWPALFLELICERHSEGRRDTPLVVLGMLENDIREFNASVEIARRVIATHPELVAVSERTDSGPTGASDGSNASEQADTVAPDAQPAPDPAQPGPSTQERASETAAVAARFLGNFFGRLAKEGAKLDSEQITLLRNVTNDLAATVEGEESLLPSAAWADTQIRALEEFAHDCPEALSLDHLNRLAKLARVETAAENPSTTAQASRCAHARNHA